MVSHAGSAHPLDGAAQRHDHHGSRRPGRRAAGPGAGVAVALVLTMACMAKERGLGKAQLSSQMQLPGITTSMLVSSLTLVHVDRPLHACIMSSLPPSSGARPHH